MKDKIHGEINSCCALCEYAKKIELTGEYLCSRSKTLKRVTEDFVCKKFSFDILSYRPVPSKIPNFNFSFSDDNE